jgi:chaperonin GroES
MLQVQAQIKPLGDRVVVRALAKEEVTKSGIVLPDTAREKPQEGQVVAVGPGRVADDGKRLPMEVKEGDTVIYARYAGSEVKLDEVEYLLLSEKDILAVVSR